MRSIAGSGGVVEKSEFASGRFKSAAERVENGCGNLSDSLLANESWREVMTNPRRTNQSSLIRLTCIAHCNRGSMLECTVDTHTRGLEVYINYSGFWNGFSKEQWEFRQSRNEAMEHYQSIDRTSAMRGKIPSLSNISIPSSCFVQKNRECLVSRNLCAQAADTFGQIMSIWFVGLSLLNWRYAI